MPGMPFPELRIRGVLGMELDNVTLGILAGGKSTRMGRDKALLLWNGRTLAEHVRMQLACCKRVLVSVADAERAQGVPYPAVADERQGYGPLEGIYRLLAAAQTEWVFVVATDLPLVNEELLSCLLEALEAARGDEDGICSGMERAGNMGILAVIPCSEGRVHPLCGLYHKCAVKLLLPLLDRGEHRVCAFLDELPVVYVPVEKRGIDARVFSNVNTPEEFRKLEAAGMGQHDAPEKVPYVFAVCGVKNSGKTTYLEKLVAALKEHGVRVGVIKHDGHEFEGDVPGTDSSRMYQAGADATVVFSDGQLLFHERGNGPWRGFCRCLQGTISCLLREQRLPHCQKSSWCGSAFHLRKFPVKRGVSVSRQISRDIARREGTSLCIRWTMCGPLRRHCSGSYVTENCIKRELRAK